MLPTQTFSGLEKRNEHNSDLVQFETNISMLKLFNHGYSRWLHWKLDSNTLVKQCAFFQNEKKKTTKKGLELRHSVGIREIRCALQCSFRNREKERDEKNENVQVAWTYARIN